MSFNGAEIQARYRARHPDRVAQQSRAEHQRKRAYCSAVMRELKVWAGCLDCGYKDNADALQFDHVKGVKVDNITTIASRGLSPKLMEELRKCEVRCANCHAIRTAKHENLRKAATRREQVVV